jgi:glucans biosynthesis protein C
MINANQDGLITEPPQRFADLDALRAFAMFLGIIIHGVISFAANPVPFWPVHDPRTTGVADACLFVIHDFRMQTFFLLAGFFSALLTSKYGLSGFLKHRLMRVGIPFILGLLIINPVLQYYWLVGDPVALSLIQLTLGQPVTPAPAFWGDYYTSGQFLKNLYPLHLWFLWFLLQFYLMMVPILVVGKRIPVSPLRRIQAKLLTRRYGVFVLALLFMPLLWFMKMWIVDTPGAWLPPWHVWVYYFLFFTFGWLLHGQKEILKTVGLRWRGLLILANFVVMPLYLAAVLQGANVKFQGSLVLPKLIAMYLGPLYTWLMILALLGLFRHYFHQPRGWVRYLADASYWCYIMSLIPLIGLQMLVQDWDTPVIVKLIFVHVVAMALLLVSYHFLVRGRFLGRLLNGRPRSI